MTLRDADYCPYCGTPLESTVVDGRERRRCPEHETVIFRQPYVTTEVAVVDREGAPDVLFVERGSPPDEGAWALPGGHLEFDEDPAAGAARELEEETGLSVAPDALHPLGGRNLDGQYPDTRCLLLAYAVPRTECTGTLAAEDDATEAAFLPLPSLADREVWAHSTSFAERAIERWGATP